MKAGGGWTIKMPDGDIVIGGRFCASEKAAWKWFEPWPEYRPVLKKNGYRAVFVELREIKRRKK